MFTKEEIDYLNSLLDGETSPLVDSILDKLEENTIINLKLNAHQERIKEQLEWYNKEETFIDVNNTGGKY